MQKKLFAKLGLIVFLSLLLLIPLGMIEGQIVARSARQADVVQDVADSAAGAQTLVGPVLVVRYRERVEVRDKDKTFGNETVRHEIVERTQVLPPQRLNIEGDANVESRNRGIYRASLYHLSLKLDGRAEVPPRLGLDAQREIIDAQAFLMLGIADPRGVDNDPEVMVNGTPRRFAAGAQTLSGPGVHVALGEIDVARGATFDFSLPLSLTGSARLSIAPAGDATTVSLNSTWPHPSFQGRFLPTTRNVSGSGFTASWQVSHLARNFDRVLAAARTTSPTEPASWNNERSETLDISFIDPVNIYLQSERAVKYGALFIALTFAAFFLVEILRRAPIHPLQYILVGLALAVFFLLLIALSEHVPFAIAYGVSMTACVGLIGFYLAGTLGSHARGAAFGGGIAVLYGVLYGVLLSEDNALLMGSALLFVALGTIMLATRRIDWYRFGMDRIVGGNGHAER